MSDLDPEVVAERLRRAAALFSPPTLDELRETPPPPDLSPEVVQARLDELRELIRLADYLAGTARSET